MDTSNVLQKLTIADARALLEKTRTSMDAKRTEMQLVVGERYLGLIESADSISAMHNSSFKLADILRNIPTGCEELRKCVLSPSSGNDIAPTEEVDEGGAVATDSFEIGASILFLLDAPEKMWLHLDEGQPFEAMKVFYKARGIFYNQNIQQCLDEKKFLIHQWSCIMDFPQRLCLSAKKCISTRGMSENVYGGALCVLLVLENLSVPDVLEAFLASRKEWIIDAMNLDLSRIQPKEKHYPAIRRSFLIGLKTMSDTLLHIKTLFSVDDDDVDNMPEMKNRFLAACAELHRISGEHNLENGSFPPLKELHQQIQGISIKKRFTSWMEEQIASIHKNGSNLAEYITTPHTLASLQTCVNKVLVVTNPEDSKDWKNSCFKVIDSTFRPRKRHKDGSLDLWAILFEDIFVRRTGSLVQHSYSSTQQKLQESLLRVLDPSSSHVSLDTFVKGKTPLLLSKIDQDNNTDFSLVFSIINTFNSELRMLADCALVLDRQTESSEVESSSVQVALRERCILMIISLLGFFRSLKNDMETKKDMNETVEAEHVRKVLFLTRFCAAMAHGTVCFPKLLDVHSNARPLSDSKIKIAFKAGCSTDSRLMPFGVVTDALKKLLPDLGELVNYPALDMVTFEEFSLLARMKNVENCLDHVKLSFEHYSSAFATLWAKQSIALPYFHLQASISSEEWNIEDEVWRQLHGRWEEVVIEEEGELGEEIQEKVFMPICESPYLGYFIMALCSLIDRISIFEKLDSISRDPTFVQTVDFSQGVLARMLCRKAVDILTELYKQVIEGSDTIKPKLSLASNMYEASTLQLAFDLSFLGGIFGSTATSWKGYGFSEDKESQSDASDLATLFDEVKARIDPVDWELYAPLISERVERQIQRSSLLLAVLNAGITSAKKDCFMNGTIAKDHILSLAKTTARFTMLPVPLQVIQKDARKTDALRAIAREVDVRRQAAGAGDDGQAFLAMAGKAGRSLMGQVGSNIRAASGSNIFSSASSGAGNIFASASKSNLFASASSYLRDGENKN